MELQHSPDTVADLVDRARAGDSSAWTAICERYESLVRSVARSYRLWGADLEDVTQAVWLALFQHIDDIRNPDALPGWISTTARNVCNSEVKRMRRWVSIDPVNTLRSEFSVTPWLFQAAGQEDIDEGMLRDEDCSVLRDGLAELAPRQQELLLLLVADPPLPYAEIARRLDMPVGSIGPTRARCLKKLRETAAMSRLETVQQPTGLAA